jgi:hypothetical protein
VNIITDSDEVENFPSEWIQDLAYSLVGELGFERVNELSDEVIDESDPNRDSLDQLELRIAERIFNATSNSLAQIKRRVRVRQGASDEGVQIMRRLGAVEDPRQGDDWGKSFLDSRRKKSFQIWRDHLVEVLEERDIPQWLLREGPIELTGSDVWSGIVTSSDWISIEEDELGILALWIIDRISMDTHEEIQQEARNDVDQTPGLVSPSDFVKMRRRRQAELMVDHIDFSESLLNDRGPYDDMASNEGGDYIAIRGPVLA